jgi:hypothetical protein
MNDLVASAIRNINTSLPVEISREEFAAILRTGSFETRWSVHVRIFLEEAPVGLLHDLALSHETGFVALERLYAAAGVENETRRWVDEMAR